MSFVRSRGLLRGAAIRVGVIGAVMTVALAGCGSSSNNNAQSGSGGGTTALKVTTLGLCNEVPVYWAMDKGIFAKNKLSVSLVKSSGGAAALAALQGGSVDVAFTNPLSAILAAKQGITVRWIATAYEYPLTQDKATAGVFVKDDSGISRPKDLNGKKVAANELGGIGQASVSALIQNDGGDPSTVKFVALPFAQLLPAVQNGTVDAATISLQSTINAKGVHSLGDAGVAASGGKPTPYAGYVVTGAFLDKHQAAAQAFFKSLDEADKAINDPANASEKFRLEGQGCKQDPAALAKVQDYTYAAAVDMPGYTQLAQLLVKQGVLTQLPDIKSLVPSFAQASQ